MSLTWNDDLLTGISEIDIQHKELFNWMNRFFDACDRGKGREEIIRVFEFLSNYILYHFNAEEEQMMKYNYPDYTDHKQKHLDFAKDYQELKKQVGDAFKGSSTLKELRVQIETNRLLGQWVINHINDTDKKLALFLKSQGAH